MAHFQSLNGLTASKGSSQYTYFYENEQELNEPESQHQYTNRWVNSKVALVVRGYGIAQRSLVMETKRYKKVRKRHNQKENPTPKTEVGKKLN